MRTKLILAAVALALMQIGIGYALMLEREAEGSAELAITAPEVSVAAR